MMTNPTNLVGAWGDVRLRKWAMSGGIAPYISDNINPASIDLRVGKTFRYPTENGWSDELPIPESGLVFGSGELMLLCTEETTIIPDNAIAILFLKSSKARLGFNHLHAGFGDPGFNGQWTLEVVNHWPFRRTIKAGERFIQMVLFDCSEVEKDYTKTGHYCNQVGPTPTHKDYTV